MPLPQLLVGGAGEADQLAVAHGVHGGRSGAAIDQRHLPDQLRPADLADLDLGPAIAPAEHAEPAGGDQVGGVTVLAFGEQAGTGRDGDPLHHLVDRVEHVLVDEPEQVGEVLDELGAAQPLGGAAGQLLRLPGVVGQEAPHALRRHGRQLARRHRPDGGRAGVAGEEPDLPDHRSGLEQGELLRAVGRLEEHLQLAVDDHEQVVGDLASGDELVAELEVHRHELVADGAELGGGEPGHELASHERVEHGGAAIGAGVPVLRWCLLLGHRWG